MFNFSQNLLQNLDLLSVGITVAATALLGFIVFFSNPKSIMHRTFLLFSLVTSFWGVANYLNYQIFQPEISLWLLRITIFFGTWHAFSFFQLSYVFPKETAVFPKSYFRGLVPAVALVSLLTLTPFVFSHVLELDAAGRIIKISNGPGIAVFTAVVLSLVISGIYLLIKKTRKASGQEKNQFRSILIGTFITFLLLMVFNFILPAFFDTPRFIPLGALFIFPFIIFVFYAIAKQHFLDIKVVSTALITFLLTIGTFFEILTAEDTYTIILKSVVFILVLIFGVFLIKNVLKEVSQREELQRLTGELTDANRELKRLDEQKSDFISIASHQLRTPLTIIKGYISLIFEKSFGALPEYLIEPLKRVELSNNRLINLVNDLLDLSRIERGKMTYVFQEGSLMSVVEEVYTELQEAAKQKKLAFTLTRPDGPVPNVNLDPKKIKEVLINLIDNALHYTKEGSVAVAVTYNPERNVIRVAVTDTGIGLNEDDIKHIFVKFSRMESAKQVSSEGTGLGLYVAKLIIEDHKGKIWAESKGHTKGSTFAFELPTLPLTS